MALELDKKINWDQEEGGGQDRDECPEKDVETVRGEELEFF